MGIRGYKTEGTMASQKSKDLRIYRLLKPELIRLWEHVDEPIDEETGEPIPLRPERITEIVLQKCVDVLDETGAVKNKRKLFAELLFREKENPTAIGDGIAIPHVRSVNVRELVMCFLRFPEGVRMKSLDGEPVYFVFCIVVPKFLEDITGYQRIYRKLIDWLRSSNFREELSEAKDAGEVIRAIRMME